MITVSGETSFLNIFVKSRWQIKCSLAVKCTIFVLAFDPPKLYGII